MLQAAALASLRVQTSQKGLVARPAAVQPGQPHQHRPRGPGAQRQSSPSPARHGLPTASLARCGATGTLQRKTARCGTRASPQRPPPAGAGLQEARVRDALVRRPGTRCSLYLGPLLIIYSVIAKKVLLDIFLC